MDLIFEYLFGMRICPFCPDCNNGKGSTPCQDIFGSSAQPEGGSAGRLDATYVSFEAQKSQGSLHGHGQLFPQCLHQHTPLREIAQRLAEPHVGRILVEKYLRYKSHVCRQVYENEKDLENQILETEAEWPEYRKSEKLISRPSYQGENDPVPNCEALLGSSTESVECERTRHGLVEQAKWRLQCGRSWLGKYMEDVQCIQKMKQHHVHPMGDNGERKLLEHCKRKDKPKECKSDFPRTKQLVEKAVVVCRGLAARFGMAISGRRNRLGCLHGPMNHESLNGSHPCSLAALRTKNYRFAAAISIADL